MTTARADSADPSRAPRDAHEAFAGLVRWINCSGAGSATEEQQSLKAAESCFVDLAGDAACSSTRGLSASADIPPGGIIVRLPWSCAITPTSVLRSSSLKRKRSCGAGGRRENETPCPLAHSSLSFFPTPPTGLLPGRRLLALRDLLRSHHPNGSSSHHPLLPHPWSLLLALGLLCELADPLAPRRLYASLLPSPPGTPLAAAAPFGPAATDILLFKSGELDALKCEPLARAARRERRRLAALHGLLFGGNGGGGEGDESRGDEEQQGQGPSVSLISFLWAHSLVRSRALDLRVVGSGEEGKEGGGKGGGGGEVCLLPLIDLAQHDDGKGGGSAPATLRLVSSPSPSPSSPSPSPAAVELVAGASGIPRGSPVCLNYGRRPLRDLLRGYAFVPKVVAAEPFPASSSSPSPPSALSRASEVLEDFSGQSLANRAALVVDASASCSDASLLRLASVRLLAEPGGEDAALEFGSARVVFVVVGGGGGGEGSSDGSRSIGSFSSSPVIFTATDEKKIPMRPEVEAGVCRWVARECEELASEIEGWSREDGKKAEGENCDDDDDDGRGAKGASPPSSSSWLSRAAEELASDYRAARFALLRRCSESLEAQAWLVESCLEGDAL